MVTMSYRIILCLIKNRSNRLFHSSISQSYTLNSQMTMPIEIETDTDDTFPFDLYILNKGIVNER